MNKYKNKKLAIIGASYLQVPLIKKAKSLGLETHVFAWKASDPGEFLADFFYPISIVDKEDILKKCQEIGIDGICSIASDLAVITVNYVANAMGLIGNSLSCSEKSTNKYKMRQAFASNNLPSASSILVSSINDIEYSSLSYPLIVKPTDRSGSRAIHLVKKENINELSNAIRNATEASLEKKALVESVILGDEYSVECVSWKGKHTLLAVTKKYTTGSPDFIETAHVEPADIDNHMISKIKEIIFMSLDALDIAYGASHSEIKINNGDIGIIEIGSRMGGDFIGSELVYQSTGIDFVKAVIDISLNISPDLTPQIASKTCGVRFIFNQEDLDILTKIEKDAPNLILTKDVHNIIHSNVCDSSSRNGYYIMVSNDARDILKYMPSESI